MSALKDFSTEACEAYDAIAPAYDVFTGGYAYEEWLAGLERLAQDHGLAGRRLLDVACGTGASFLPMLSRGYEVTGCDISAQMLERAQAKAPSARLQLADMRRLPELGRFDLVTCLDDAMNYLLEEHELEATLRGIAANLAFGGVAVWDLNTLAQYRGQFSSDLVIDDPSMFIGWSAKSRGGSVRPGALVEVAIDVFAPCGGDQWRRTSSVHRQRHWPRATVERIATSAGLRIVEVRGQHPGAVIDDTLDEHVHIKAVYVAIRRREVS